MADHTPIEWTDATWNPVTGCSVVSPGCTNCYAMKLAGTRLKHTPSRKGLTIDTKAGPVWNGKVRLNEQWLDQPLKWKRPRRIFVCAHGDLFHESVPDEWIARVFAVMALSPQHTFQILTKRSARMRAYVRSLPNRDDLVADQTLKLGGDHRRVMVAVRNPLPNVWLGVSAEDQKRADERIPDLLATPAAIRFVSAEPLLGPIDFTRLKPSAEASSRYGGFPNLDALRGAWFIDGHRPDDDAAEPGYLSLDWIIAGGESGQGSRPMHPAWARQIRDQCKAVGTAFFFKQWGHWADINQSDAADNAGWHARGTWMILDKHGDMDIPDHRWPDEEAGEVAVINVGKKAAGRLLDGLEHNDFPLLSSTHEAAGGVAVGDGGGALQ